MYRNLKDIHIGSIIKRIIDDRKVSYSMVGQWLNVDRSSVYNLFAKKSIDIERLIILSRHLEYDFIKEVYQECDQESGQVMTLDCKDAAQLRRMGLTSLKVHIEARSFTSNHEPDTTGEKEWQT